MALPLKYNFRNVTVRWRSTIATVLGIALVVAVFVLLRALARGIEASAANTGDRRNILVVRKGSQAESGSIVTREQFRVLQYFEEIARNEHGEPVISAELALIVSAPRRNASGEANVIIRGVTPRYRVASAGDAGGRPLVCSRQTRGRGFATAGQTVCRV